MDFKQDFELLESLFVKLDPLIGAGVLMEIHRQGNWYVLLETASATGNRLLKFSSKDKELIYAVLAQELGISTR